MNTVLFNTMSLNKPCQFLFMYENAGSAHKFLHVIKDTTHFEMYDGDKHVRENVAVIADFFEKYL